MTNELQCDDLAGLILRRASEVLRCARALRSLGVEVLVVTSQDDALVQTSRCLPGGTNTLCLVRTAHGHTNRRAEAR